LNTTGLFAQYDLRYNRLTASVGARLDNYRVFNAQSENDANKTGTVLSPRISLMYDVAKPLQARLTYSQGYRAPSNI
jgi:outer membrane receptor for ferrienterochelin and colicins